MFSNIAADFFSATWQEKDSSVTTNRPITVLTRNWEEEEKMGNTSRKIRFTTNKDD